MMYKLFRFNEDGCDRVKYYLFNDKNDIDK